MTSKFDKDIATLRSEFSGSQLESVLTEYQEAVQTDTQMTFDASRFINAVVHDTYWLTAKLPMQRAKYVAIVDRYKDVIKKPSTDANQDPYDVEILQSDLDLLEEAGLSETKLAKFLQIKFDTDQKVSVYDIHLKTLKLADDDFKVVQGLTSSTFSARDYRAPARRNEAQMKFTEYSMLRTEICERLIKRSGVGL